MFLVKLALSNLIIIACVIAGKRLPALSGLIATMPITSLIVLIWLATDNPGDTKLITSYTRGVLWGILPTIAFFAVTYYCLRKGNELPLALAAGSVCWLVGALLHQWALK